MTEPDPTQGPGGEPPVPSGLRNPARAVRGAAAGALVAEGVVLMLAVQPMRVVGVSLTRLTIGVVVGLAVTCFVAAGLLKRVWTWHLGTAVQVALVVAGLAFHLALTVLGVLFGLVWLYVLHVRRTVTPRRPAVRRSRADRGPR